jgi:hypothetical protein
MKRSPLDREDRNRRSPSRSFGELQALLDKTKEGVIQDGNRSPVHAEGREAAQALAL